MNAADMLEALVRIPSVSGEEATATAWLVERARQDGLAARIDDVGNAIIEAGDGPVHVLFVGHIDTVDGDLPVERRDGAIWGRGAVDAKGCLAMAYQALLAPPPGIRFTFVAAVGEETDSRGTIGLAVERPDIIINGEPSGWAGFTLGYKGILRGTFQATGTPTHGGHPDPGALDRVVAWWAAARATLGDSHGFAAIQMRLDDLSYDADALQQTARGRYQIRLPPGADPDETFLRLCRAAEPRQVTVTCEESLPAALGDPRSPLAVGLRAAIRELGGEPRPLHKTGTSDFNHLAKRFPGIPIVAYGPGDSSLDHAPDERVEIAELERSVAVFQAALAALPSMLVAA